MVIQIDKIKINYEVFGEGEPLLVLHGWMACIDAMAPINQYFSKTRKVIVLDFPGQGGKSDLPPVAWGVPEYAEMIKKFLKELKIKSCDVIGHSFGGRVIIYLASQDPSLFQKIILVDAAGIKPKVSIKKKISIYTYKFMRRILKFITPKEQYEEKLNELRKKYGSSDYGTIQTEIMRDSFKKIIQLDLKEKLKEITNPTLILWGEEDKDTPLYMAKMMEQKIKDSGLVIIKNAGHFSYLDNPNYFLTVADNFLRGA